MKISDLDLDSQSINFLHSEGFTELYEPQAKCIEKGLFDDKKNFLVSIPTASGKTLIAMLAIISHLSKHKTRVVYLTPLRALASEKFEEFKKLEKIGLDHKIKVAISTGDFNSANKKLDDADVIILVNETMDANMAFKTDWIYDVGLVISDEIHLIGDSTRGATLEMILSRLVTGFLGKTPPKIIGLSATISNGDELAEWLKCELVESEWRPVPLIEAVYSNHTIMTSQDSEYSEGNLKSETESRHKKPAIGLGLETIEYDDQCLIFSMTRRSSVATAIEAGLDVGKMLTENQKKELQKISKKILPKDNEDQTKLINKLADTVKNGTAFHHAGLDQRCRTIIETEFRNGHIKLLTATPTLAAGVNLPARRVVISSVMRYTQNGLEKISVLEYKQMCGRAGRPQYDNEGESILIAKGSPYDFIEHYVDGEPEPLKSPLFENEKSLRIHLLSFIKTSSVFDPVSNEKINKFFSSTFAGYQKNDDDKVESEIQNRLKELINCQVITLKDNYEVTKFGEKVFWLRLDPETAFKMIHQIDHRTSGSEHTFGLLHMITNLEEFYPKNEIDLDNLPKHERDWTAYQKTMKIIINHHGKEKLYSKQDLKGEWHGYEDENDPNSFKISCHKSLVILHEFINGMSYSDMSEQFDAEGGDIFYMKENAMQLLYAFREICRFRKALSLVGECDTLRKRIQYGVPEKLLKLVEIRNVGRVRAENLYSEGYQSPESLKDISLEKLAKIDKIGIAVAKSIKSQLENSKK